MALTTESRAAPLILNYEDYRLYLKDFYEYKKSLSSGFSYRLFAAKAKLKSPNYLQLVIQGKRRLSVGAALHVAKAIKLSADETDYFKALVSLSLAEDPGERQSAEKLKLKTRSKLVLREIPHARRQILEQPQHLLIRELVTLKDFEFSPKWISKKMSGVVSEEEAAESLSMLVAAGYLKIDQNSKILQSEPAISTGQAFDEKLVLNYHVQILKLWSTLLEDLHKDKRELGILNIPMNSQKLPELKKRIRAFQGEIIGWLESEVEPDTLVQLGTYMIPVTS